MTNNNYDYVDKNMKEIESNYISKEWYLTFQKIYSFTIGCSVNLHFTNTDYVAMLNDFHSLQSIQTILNESNSISDWIKYMTNHIVDYLDNSLQKINFDPYHESSDIVVHELLNLSYGITDILSKYMSIKHC